MKVKIQDYDIERAHRIGRKNNRDRPIIVRFNNYKKKVEVMGARNNLTGSKIGMAEDFSEMVREKRDELKGYMLNAKQKGHRASLRFDKLVVDGRYYTLEDLRETKAPSSTGPATEAERRSRAEEQRDNTTPKTVENIATSREEDRIHSQEDKTAGGLRSWLLPGPVTRSKASTRGKPRHLY